MALNTAPSSSSRSSLAHCVMNRERWHRASALSSLRSSMVLRIRSHFRRRYMICDARCSVMPNCCARSRTSSPFARRRRSRGCESTSSSSTGVQRSASPELVPGKPSIAHGPSDLLATQDLMYTLIRNAESPRQLGLRGARCVALPNDGISSAVLRGRS